MNQELKEKIKLFLKTKSQFDIVWKFAGKPMDVILLGSGTDLDALGGWRELVRRTPGTLVRFNNKTMDCPRTDVWIANRAHGPKALKALAKGLQCKVVLVKKERDGDVHGTQEGNILTVRRDIQDPFTALIPPKVSKVSMGFYGAIFLKFCRRVYLAGYDGYLKIPRKRHRWHSGVPIENPTDLSSLSISGKAHDYNTEFAMMMNIIKRRKIELYCSVLMRNALREKGLEANLWQL